MLMDRCRYHSVRIDAVHYCDREYDLAQKRKRKSFTGRSGDVRDPAQERLALFSRTVRENDDLAVRVRYLKTPVMMRESARPDLARAVSVLPNLRYVDLPDSFYTSNPAARTLKLELEARCLDIRRMKYMRGSEDSFTLLGHGGQWPNLEILELDGLAVDPPILESVITSLSALAEIILVNVPTIDNDTMGLLPPVASVTIKDSPDISIEGIANYFSHPNVDSNLTSLTLTNTSIHPSTLNQILASASQLKYLSTSESVSRSLPTIPPPPLASRTLQTLHYEISSSPSERSPSSPSDSYYTYLATSVQAGGLPELTNLYALSITLPSLLLSPTKPGHRTTLSSPINRASTTSPPEPHRPLNLYTKITPELEWNLTVIMPTDYYPTRPNNGTTRRSSAPKTRPLSLYHPPELSPQWKGTGRESVMVGNGFGGYLMVPGNDATVGGRSPRRREKDGWMG